MDWTQAKATALDLLRNAYNREIERIAEELRPRIESRELGGWRGDDTPPDEPYEGPDPMFRLEDEMRARIVTDEESGFLVLAVSPSEHDDLHGDATYAAGDVAALDVMRVALARGWYVPRPEEHPSAATLALRAPGEVKP
jgi:hypothetical protein